MLRHVCCTDADVPCTAYCWLVCSSLRPTGLETGTLTLSSAAAGSPYVLSLTGNGLPLTACC